MVLILKRIDHQVGVSWMSDPLQGNAVDGD